MRSLLALAISIAATAGPAVAQTPSAVPSFTEMRRLLKASRLAASDELDRKGALRPEQRSAIEKQAGNANQLWTICLRLGVEQQARSDAEERIILDNVMRECAGDREELGAWLRFERRVGIHESSGSVEQELANLDAMNQRLMVGRIRAMRR
jgi:hypothetical protein